MYTATSHHTLHLRVCTPISDSIDSYQSTKLKPTVGDYRTKQISAHVEQCRWYFGGWGWGDIIDQLFSFICLFFSR